MQIRKKSSGNQKTFQDNGHNQGSKKVPMKQVKEYGTGLPYKKPAAPLAKKQPVNML